MIDLIVVKEDEVLWESFKAFASVIRSSYWLLLARISKKPEQLTAGNV